MKFLWTFAKVVLVLVLAVPVSIIVLSMALGILGALVGLAFLTLRIAIIGLVVWAGFSLAARLFGWGRNSATAPVVRELPLPVDPYYEAAKRELDVELGDARG